MGYRAPVFHAPGFTIAFGFRFCCPPCGDLGIELLAFKRSALKVYGFGFRITAWDTQTSFCKQPLLPTKETRNRPAPFRWMIAEWERRVVRTFLPTGV